MANLNKVMLIGRLTRDPEVRTFTNGGKVAKFGFAVNNRRKNTTTNEWEDEPVYLDVDAFNRGEFGKLADRVEQYLRKGKQIFIEGHLKLEQWTAQDGQKRSKISIVCDNFQFLEARDSGSDSGGPPRAVSAPRLAHSDYVPSPDYNEHLPALDPAPSRSPDEIPF